MIYILLILSLIACSFFFTLYITVKKELKYLQDTFQLKILAKHIALTREIDALSKIRRSEADFTELDKIINNLKGIHLNG